MSPTRFGSGLLVGCDVLVGLLTAVMTVTPVSPVARAPGRGSGGPGVR